MFVPELLFYQIRFKKIKKEYLNLFRIKSIQFYRLYYNEVKIYKTLEIYFFYLYKIVVTFLIMNTENRSIKMFYL